ncbi:hypothetical protein [Actinopolymorpha pittospori]|uniref:Uncharacterized protein n=1 Tax=Actinopolymorpha pittospori TaxID=648752 RepID=A0A927RCF6_9ACTN|nr:hypothetical protein [Actinopolymorpha pittospori]MBE1609844.1 hypothetical protein [Actinopolymorpha pittospori]
MRPDGRESTRATAPGAPRSPTNSWRRCCKVRTEFAAGNERVDGSDTILAARPEESREDIQDRLYRSRHYASPRMLTRHRIAEVLYAGIGAGLLEAVPAARVDDTVSMMVEAMLDGRLHPRMLAAHGE